MDVKNDVEEQIKQEQLIPQIDLSQDEKDEIDDAIDALSKRKDWKKDLRKYAAAGYQKVTALEKTYGRNKEDPKLAKALAYAKEIYNYSKPVVKAARARRAAEEAAKNPNAKPVAPAKPVFSVKFKKQVLPWAKSQMDALSAEVANERKKGYEETKAMLKKAYKYFSVYKD